MNRREFIKKVGLVGLGVVVLPFLPKEADGEGHFIVEGGKGEYLVLARANSSVKPNYSFVAYECNFYVDTFSPDVSHNLIEDLIDKAGASLKEKMLKLPKAI